MEIVTQRTDLRTQRGKEREGQVGRAALTHTLPCIKWIAGGTRLTTQGAQPDALWQPRGGWGWELGGRLRGRGRVYTHGLELSIQKLKVRAPSPIISWQMDGVFHFLMETVVDFIFLGSQSLRTVTAAMKLKGNTCSLESYDKPRQCIKKLRHHFADKGLCDLTYGYSGSQVRMWQLDHKEG